MSERNGDLWLQTDSSSMEKQMNISWKQYDYLILSIMQFLERRHLFTTSCLCEEIEMQTRNIIKNWRQTSTQKVSSNLTLVKKSNKGTCSNVGIGCRPLPAKCHPTLPFYPEASSLPSPGGSFASVARVFMSHICAQALPGPTGQGLSFQHVLAVASPQCSMHFL